MLELTDSWIVPGLFFVAEWSLRWALVLLVLALWFVLRAPRRAATRHLLCSVALATGLLLPVMPRWRVEIATGPTRQAAVVAAPIASSPIADASRLVDPRPPEPEALVSRPSERKPDVVRPVSQPAPKPLGAWRLAAIGIAAIWAWSVLILSARLVGGRRLLAKLKARALPCGDCSARLLVECRRALGLSRPTSLAAHPAISSPVVIGGRMPMILVPPDWDDWPVAHRRDCLLHELAHLQRRDDWAKLVQELVSIPFFFHPLVRWLLKRLDRERELLCDEAVVALGGDPVGYARLLLDLARRPGRLLLSAAARRPGWLPFFDRGTVAVRIERLLEDDMMRPPSPLSVRRLFAMGTLALAAALGIGGLQVRAVEPKAKQENPPDRATARPEPAPANVKKTRTIEGLILEAKGKPAAGATVVAGITGTGKPNHQVFKTDKNGRFVWPIPDGPLEASFVAYHEGRAPAFWQRWLPVEKEGDQVELTLHEAEPFEGVLVDGDGRPVAKAQVRIERLAQSYDTPGDEGVTYTTTVFSSVPRDILSGSPLNDLFQTTTDQTGAFALPASLPKTWLKRGEVGLRLGVTVADREWRVRAEKEARGHIKLGITGSGFVAATAGSPARLIAFPAARVAGRVTTALPSVGVAGLVISFQDSNPDKGKGTYHSSTNDSTQKILTGEDGRFVLDGLNEGTINIFVHGEGDGDSWTYRAGKDVPLKSGETTERTLELIRGVEVEGKVVAEGTGLPIPGAEVAQYGPRFPRTGAATRSDKTDAEGRYHFRLPSGETYFYVMGPAAGYMTRLGEDRGQTVTIPEGVTRYEVPPLELVAAVTVRGRVIDAQGSPVAGAKVVGVCEGNSCLPFPGAETLTDASGRFRLPTGWNSMVPVGQPARLRIQLPHGATQDAVAVPAGDGSFTAKLTAASTPPKGVEAPREVAEDELAGVIVDAQGKPIEGVEAHAWHWAPGRVAHTDQDGRFRIAKLGKDQKIEIRFRKEGYETQFHLDKLTGEPGWVVILGNSTFFEGRVLGPDGSPVSDAMIRADSGPRRGSGFVLSECFTETKSGKDGRYRLYVEPGQYDIEVRSPGIGVARLSKEMIAADQARTQDIRLVPGINFVARVIDHETGKPVAGVTLSHWQKPGIEGTSDADGRIEIHDVPPGKYPRFEVKAEGYTRWWSDACLSEWNRFQIDAGRGFQRNFDSLDFNVEPGMPVVTIELERGATVRGRVLDPDGKPVAGATVAPALTGTGNSLTGDTRFSVPTDAEGRFTVLLPASAGRDYNLVAHDGKYGQWRTWANGVLPPFRTKPGEEISDVELRLTRPATIRGRVTDSVGKPVADREVRASAADRLENRYYDPTAKTDKDGNYELKYVRSGQQFIQVAPFWLDARQAPEGTSQELTLEPGESKEGLDFQIRD